MYEVLLNLHSWLRWFVLGLAIIVIYQNYNGWKSVKVYTNQDKKLNTYLMILLHSQLVIGLLLYFGVSPIMKDILSDFGASMKNSSLRFWSIEHLFGMVLAIIIAQIGASKAKNNYRCPKIQNRVCLFQHCLVFNFADDSLGFLE
ncbi:MAG: hypothetical protein IPI50_01125 [Saprospiraceae bacterium]|nr:hypothetical protein [Saprospiraceae bacterium]